MEIIFCKLSNSKKIDTRFTQSELKFFNVLNKEIDNKNYFLFTKIRLIDLLKLRKAKYK